MIIEYDHDLYDISIDMLYNWLTDLYGIWWPFSIDFDGNRWRHLHISRHHHGSSHPSSKKPTFSAPQNTEMEYKIFRVSWTEGTWFTWYFIFQFFEGMRFISCYCMFSRELHFLQSCLGFLSRLRSCSLIKRTSSRHLCSNRGFWIGLARSTVLKTSKGIVKHAICVFLGH